ncbi:MAG: DegT/DnrJ/EryC1/StrS aminotransferase family protein [Spirochaetaceae bacterium]|jgi:dTDP-4-amino-4,6-dideoxygalactose transaminase|nr:DegT/DnrJ/EryC1/StrS aminotransferase family protein [Spirochaetaceae bacterium]
MTQETIPFAKPFIGKEEEDAVLNVLRSGWLTTGPQAASFEQEFAEFLGGGDLRALAVNSATSGLHLAIEACGVKAGDVVITPSYTFAATAAAAVHLGAEIAFADTARDSFLICPDRLERTVKRLAEGKSAYPDGGPKGVPKAVIPVHFGGLPCDMDAIMRIARQYSLAVIEDAAHSFPAPLGNGRFAGTEGDAGVFSFYATKTITAGEGGMVVTRNGKLAQRIELMRLHGIDRPVWNRYTENKAAWYYEIEEAGFKCNFCDLLAAVGRVQLQRAVQLWEMRKTIAAAYDTAFSADERFFIPPTSAANARHLYPLRINPEKCSGTRNQCVEKLQNQGIGVSVHFIPLHTMPYYVKRYGFKPEDFPETMRSFLNEISLPLWPGMNPAQIERVIKAVQYVC